MQEENHSFIVFWGSTVTRSDSQWVMPSCHCAAESQSTLLNPCCQQCLWGRRVPTVYLKDVPSEVITECMWHIWHRFKRMLVPQTQTRENKLNLVVTPFNQLLQLIDLYQQSACSTFLLTSALTFVPIMFPHPSFYFGCECERHHGFASFRYTTLFSRRQIYERSLQSFISCQIDGGSQERRKKETMEKVSDKQTGKRRSDTYLKPGAMLAQLPVRSQMQ